MCSKQPGDDKAISRYGVFTSLNDTVRWFAGERANDSIITKMSYNAHMHYNEVYIYEA